VGLWPSHMKRGGVVPEQMGDRPHGGKERPSSAGEVVVWAGGGGAHLWEGLRRTICIEPLLHFHKVFVVGHGCGSERDVQRSKGLRGDLVLSVAGSRNGCHVQDVVLLI